MKISVITACLNSKRYIRQTIESVLSQKGSFELEYIIRDGCSTDGTLDILEEYKDKCIVISQKDGSPQEAINAGMNMATGNVGAWLNADDIYLPGTLQAVVNAFSSNPTKQWLYGRCNIINENNLEIRKPITLYKNFMGYFYSRNILLCENYINQPATFWKMDLWRQVSGNLDTKYKAAWDYELWLKMANTSPAIHIRKHFTSFRRHNESISENHFEKQFKEELAISNQYGNFIHYSLHLFLVNFRIFIYKILA
jgi:glycosyltransferase involved in cell wall biosynthesis